MSVGEINTILADTVRRTVISEFWINDETGRVVLTHAPGTDFTFGIDSAADRQSVLFASILSGAAPVVAHGIRPRELGGKRFKYVAVANGRRIVRDGVSAATGEEEGPRAR